MSRRDNDNEETDSKTIPKDESILDPDVTALDLKKIDTLLVDTMIELTMKKRDQALYDLHGVAEPLTSQTRNRKERPPLQNLSRLLS
jgi:mRNA deadenylase 3'-5' endonuclease subunit Ccr4